MFPDDGVRVHLGVLDICEAQHREIQRLRHDVRELLPYLKQEGIFTTLNHVASRINGAITAPHIAALMPWVDGIEMHQRLAAAVAEPDGRLPGRCLRQGRRRRQRLAHAPRHRPHLGRGAAAHARAMSS